MDEVIKKIDDEIESRESMIKYYRDQQKEAAITVKALQNIRKQIVEISERQADAQVEASAAAF